MTHTAYSTPSVTPLDVNAFPTLLARIADGALQRERDNVNPFEQVRLLATAGYGKLRLPPERGGGGLSIRELFAAIIDLGAADPTVAHILRAHFGFTEEFLTLGTPAADRFLRLVADSKIIGGAHSERGSRAVGEPVFDTTLTDKGNHLVLNGTKFYTTGTLFSDYVNVTASRGANKVSVVVPTDREGVQITDDWDGFGQRRTGSGTTQFTDVVVNSEDIVKFDQPAEPTTLAPFFQLYLHAIIAGILRTVVADAKRLVLGRTRSFTHANAAVAAADTSLQQIVGELASLAFVAEATVLVAAESIDAANNSATDGVPDPAIAQEASLATSKAKVALDEIGTRAATLLFEAGGASAASSAKNLDRHWRSIRTITLHNPARLKAQAIGAHVLHGGPLPTNGYF
jgi:alkylation response protein AidB-like acyl-CoA dehydrogenase